MGAAKTKICPHNFARGGGQLPPPLYYTATVRKVWKDCFWISSKGKIICRSLVGTNLYSGPNRMFERIEGTRTHVKLSLLCDSFDRENRFVWFDWEIPGMRQNLKSISALRLSTVRPANWSLSLTRIRLYREEFSDTAAATSRRSYDQEPISSAETTNPPLPGVVKLGTQCSTNWAT